MTAWDISQPETNPLHVMSGWRADQTDDAEAVCEALAAEGEPMTRKDLQLVTMRSGGQLRRILTDLRADGVVVRYDLPADRRLTVYGLAAWYPDDAAHGTPYAFDVDDLGDADE